MASLSETHNLPVQGTFYARFEDSDAVDREQAQPEEEEPRNLVIAFDAVRADWIHSLKESFFALDDSLEERVRDYWSGMFGGELLDPLDDPYEPVPAYRIEVSLPPNTGWIKPMLAVRDQWAKLDLGTSGEIEAHVFRGLFDPEPGVAWIADDPKTVPPRLSRQLSTAFDMDSWPDASEEDLQGLFGSLPFPPIEQLISFDVGQGTATCFAGDCWCFLWRDALHWYRATDAYGDPRSCCGCLSCCIAEACACGLPICYFDLGCGVYRNARTRPSNIQFCNCPDPPPPVILSHWDTDHWAGALEDTRFLESRWGAPRQSIGPTHTKFASKILQSGGSILIVPDRPLSVRWRGHREYITLQRATGRSRNDSGLVMQVWNRRKKKRWLLTGDADYEHIPKLPRKAAAITVPHHGASECGKFPPRPSNLNFRTS